MSLQRILESVFTATGLTVAASVLAVLAVSAVLLARVADRRRILRLSRTPAPLRVPGTVSEDHLLRRSGMIERLAGGVAPGIVHELGIGPLWIDRLAARGRPADFRRVLTYCPENGLYACFRLGLRRSRLMDRLVAYIDAEHTFDRLEALAGASDGSAIDAESAKGLVPHWVEHLTALAVHPEWNVRNFAFRLLTHHAEVGPARLVESAIDDPHPENRILSIESIPLSTDERVALLATTATDDPVAEVREAAVRVLRATGAWEGAVSLEDLNEVQRTHIAPLLDPGNDRETSTALDWLEHGPISVRLPTAQMLEQAGVLERLLEESDFGDRTGLARRRVLLGNALDVRVAGFLATLEHTNRPAVLLLGAELLRSHGDPDLVRVVAERVFRMQERVVPNYLELYEATVSALGDRGDDAALLLLLRELYARRRPELLRALLNAVPSGRDTLFAEPLLAALADESFPERQALRRAILRLDSARVLAACFSVLNAPGSAVSSQLRVDALYLISRLDLSYAVRPVLERTGSLPTDAVAGLVQVAYSMDPALTTAVMQELLESSDAPVRASLISAIPQVDHAPFSTQLKSALHDSDPDVRVAAIRTLDALGDLATLGAIPGLVRDPVTRVRSAYANALARSTTRRDISTLREAVCEVDELEEVRLCVVSALSGNPARYATETLLDLLAAEDAVSAAATGALAHSATTESVVVMANRHAKATAPERRQIELAVSSIAQNNEALLRESVQAAGESHIPALSHMLEATGFVPELLARLRHRDPAHRLLAARALARLEGVHAAAGVVLASWDSHPDVQAEVEPTLERLKSELSEEIRQELHAHPVRKVRKYSDRTFGPVTSETT